MRISDWSSDVCSSDLTLAYALKRLVAGLREVEQPLSRRRFDFDGGGAVGGNKPHERHAASRSWAPTAALIIAAALRISSVVVKRPQPILRLEIGRASCRERVCQYV